MTTHRVRRTPALASEGREALLADGLPLTAGRPSGFAGDIRLAAPGGEELGRFQHCVELRRGFLLTPPIPKGTRSGGSGPESGGDDPPLSFFLGQMLDLLQPGLGQITDPRDATMAEALAESAATTAALLALASDERTTTIALADIVEVTAVGGPLRRDVTSMIVESPEAERREVTFRNPRPLAAGLPDHVFSRRLLVEVGDLAWRALAGPARFDETLAEVRANVTRRLGAPDPPGTRLLVNGTTLVRCDQRLRELGTTWSDVLREVLDALGPAAEDYRLVPGPAELMRTFWEAPFGEPPDAPASLRLLRQELARDGLHPWTRTT
ncbi:MAG: hypothetical protein AMXMBFR46_08590 [Acidimicrobiia bacterium]